MCRLIDPAWRQEEEPDWPTLGEMAAWAAELTEAEWEAEQERIRDCCFGSLSVPLGRRRTATDHEEAA